MFNNNLSIVFWEFWTWKTYEVVQLAYKRFIEEDAIIISNMWLAFPHIRIYKNDDLIPLLDQIAKYHKEVITPFSAPWSFLLAHKIQKSNNKNRPIFILIDEWVIFFEARNFKNNFAKEQLRNMFATPRHFDMQICVIVQNYSRVDKIIRDLAQEVVETKKYFWFFRLKLSYDTNRIETEMWWLRDEIPILEWKISFPWLSYKKDMNKFFWWLYYTKEALWELAIKNPNEINDFYEYLKLTKEDLEDWRKKYQKEILNNFLNLPEKIKQKWLKDYKNR